MTTTTTIATLNAELNTLLEKQARIVNNAQRFAEMLEQNETMKSLKQIAADWNVTPENRRQKASYITALWNAHAEKHDLSHVNRQIEDLRFKLHCADAQEQANAQQEMVRVIRKDDGSWWVGSYNLFKEIYPGQGMIICHTAHPEEGVQEVQTQEELQHAEYRVLEPVEEIKTESKHEQAEMLVVEMDMVETELQQATTYELFDSCRQSLEMLKAEIQKFGYEVKRTFIGWKLVVQEQVAEVAQVASTPVQEVPAVTHYPQHFQGYAENLPKGFMIERQGQTFYCFYTIYEYGEGWERSTSQRFTTMHDTQFHYSLTFDRYEDAFAFMQGFLSMLSWMGGIGASHPIGEEVMKDELVEKLNKAIAGMSFHEDVYGLYAQVPSTNPKKPHTTYMVRIDCRRLLSVSCDCEANIDCICRLAVDRRLDGLRPTLSEQCKGVMPSRQVIDGLLNGLSHYRIVPFSGGKWTVQSLVNGEWREVNERVNRKVPPRILLSRTQEGAEKLLARHVVTKQAA